MPVHDSTQRFSSRVENYIRYRPSYPSGVVQALEDECGLHPASVIADIGSGTGFLSKIFLENGNRVIGVEPNRDMREAGDRLLQALANFTSVEGAAEATTLPSQSVDFITAGQSAHWFDRVRAHREFLRIQKPGAWTVFVWNDRSTTTTPILREYEQLLIHFGIDYQEVHRAGFETVSQIAGFFQPAPMRQKTFQNSQDFDFEGLQGRLLSSSYIPTAGHPNYEAMMQELRRLFDTYSIHGKVRFEYETQMYYGQLR